MTMTMMGMAVRSEMRQREVQEAIGHLPQKSLIL